MMSCHPVVNGLSWGHPALTAPAEEWVRRKAADTGENYRILPSVAVTKKESYDGLPRLGWGRNTKADQARRSGRKRWTSGKPEVAKDLDMNAWRGMFL